MKIFSGIAILLLILTLAFPGAILANHEGGRPHDDDKQNNQPTKPATAAATAATE